MTDIAAAGASPLGDRTVNRMGYGAMQLAGPGALGRRRIVKPRSPCCGRPSASGVQEAERNGERAMFNERDR